MKLQYLNSATVLITTDTTKVLLIHKQRWGLLWKLVPLSEIEKDIDIDDYLNVDYIYISHVHPDHLHIDTLKNFPKNIPILIHEYQHKFVYNILNSIGFNKIIQVPHKKEFRLSDDLIIEILAADDCNPEKCGLFIGCKVMSKNTKSLSIDSLAVFKSKDSVLVNTNDCPYELAVDVTKYIKNKYNKVDMFLGI